MDITEETFGTTGAGSNGRVEVGLDVGAGVGVGIELGVTVSVEIDVDVDARTGSDEVGLVRIGVSEGEEMASFGGLSTVLLRIGVQAEINKIDIMRSNGMVV